jgi:hypothetical protein
MEQMLTAPEVAKMLRVSPQRVRLMIQAGELRAADFSSENSSRPRYRIFAQNVDRLIQSKITAPAWAKPKRKRRAAKPDDEPEIRQFYPEFETGTG